MDLFCSFLSRTVTLLKAGFPDKYIFCFVTICLSEFFFLFSFFPGVGSCFTITEWEVKKDKEY